jgi:2'-hydroxyisoflavone reductase
MRLLILGGTRFLGRHLAQQALDAGHELTLLHRGISGPALFPEAHHVLADRNADLAAALAPHGSWDAAIDTGAYVPRQVRQAAAALADRVGQYQLVSSISVYARFDADPVGEDTPVQTLADPTLETITGVTYGGLKALCEEAALDTFGERALIARPGLLVGPHDPTGRFTWWVQRFVRADTGDDDEAEVLAPGDPGSPLQFIDARDAAAWLLHQAEACSSGTYNLSGPEDALTMAGFLASASQALAPAAELLWVDEAFLLQQGVAPWSELPLWLAAADSGSHRIDLARALATGLQCRPLVETLRDTAAWAALAPQLTPTAAGGPPRPPVGLAPARETALRETWRTRQGGA